MAEISGQSNLDHLLAQPWFGATRHLAKGPFLRWRSGMPVPDRIVVAPASLRSGSAEWSRTAYSGEFGFCGVTRNIGGNSPFLVLPPSRLWAAKLHGFRWLRHLQAADTPLARASAQTYVHDWILSVGAKPAIIAWEVETVAIRIIAWLQHSPLIFEGAGQDFYRDFLRSLAEQVGYLHHKANSALKGMPRLLARLAIVYASLCLRGANASKQNKFIRQSTKALGQVLNEQFYADGVHISRNPDVGLEILADLLPLQQTYLQQAIEVPPELVTTIDRVLPMLQFFRHRDGNSALFNGGQGMDRELLEIVMRVGGNFGQPPDNAAPSGYQRLRAGSTIILADTGKAHSPALSHNVHAGCLSFEMSSGSSRFVINCGSPSIGDGEIKASARSTAAHSTAVINDTSSCRFHETGALKFRSGSPIVSGIKTVAVQRSSEENGEKIYATHDGYLESFRLIHQRSLMLVSDGNAIHGIDRFVAGGNNDVTRKSDNNFTIRFHLHPRIKAELLINGISVLLTAPDGDGWKFTCVDVQITLEESIIFTGVPEPTNQIVLTSNVQTDQEIRWIFEHCHIPDQYTRGKNPSNSRQPQYDLLDVLSTNHNQPGS